MNEPRPLRLLIHFRNGRLQPVSVDLPPSSSEAYQSALQQFSTLPGLRYIQVSPSVADPR